MSTNNSLGDIAKQFATRPLFGGELGVELSQLERRNQRDSPSENLTSLAATADRSFLKLTSVLQVAASSSSHAHTSVPPPPRRPAILGQMLAKKDLTNEQETSATQEQTTTDLNTSSERRRKHKRNAVRKHIVVDRLDDGAAGGRSVYYDSSAEESEEDRRGRHARQNASKEKSSTPPATSAPPQKQSPDDDAKPEESAVVPEETQPAEAEDIKWLLKKTDERVVETHIAKAAARTALQRERLHTLGVRAPGEKQDEGCQTENTIETSTRPGVSSSTTEMHHRSQVHRVAPPPQGYVLSPSAPFEVREAPVVPNYNFNQRQEPPAATLPIEHLQSRESNSASQPVIIPRDHRQETLKHDLMHRLDQMQLQNEEVLVRNGILDDVPSKGDPRSLAMKREALGHVGTANRSGQLSYKFQSAAPLGGYGSILDRNPATEKSDSQWADAKVKIEAEEEVTAGAEALRNWASALPNVPNSMTVNQKQGIIKQPVSNVAKKKWSSVSFANPLEGSVGSSRRLQDSNDLSSFSEKANNLFSIG